MPLFRIRTQIDDRPGRLAVLTAALASCGANILDLSVQVDADGVVDEFVVNAPDQGAGPADLVMALERAGGRGTAVVLARPQELIDEPTRVLALAARLRRRPHTLPQVLTELLRADEATWVSGLAAVREPGDALTVPVGPLRAVRLRRDALAFTATEAARADALVRAVLPTHEPRPTSRRVPLRDGTQIVVRPLEPSDGPAVREMHGRCSPETRRLRYFTAKPTLPQRALDLFCAPSHGFTLVAEGPDGSILALAHLMHVIEPGVAELAFLVEDAWQGRGVGRELTELLLVLGRDRGLVELRATVLPDNDRMRRLLIALGGRVRPLPPSSGDMSAAVMEIRLRLDGRPFPAAKAARSA